MNFVDDLRIKSDDLEIIEFKEVHLKKEPSFIIPKGKCLYKFHNLPAGHTSVDGDKK